jgi:glutamine synthetase adenylyltransferase
MRSFEELRAKMSPEARKRSGEKFEDIIKELRQEDHHEAAQIALADITELLAMRDLSDVARQLEIAIEAQLNKAYNTGYADAKESIWRSNYGCALPFKRKE